MIREEMVKRVKSEMCKNCGIYLGGGKCSDNCSVTEIIQALEKEPKTGHWIKTSLTQVSGGDFKRGFKCSHCNYVIVTNDFNFCPNCGTKMESKI